MYSCFNSSLMVYVYNMIASEDNVSMDFPSSSASQISLTCDGVELKNVTFEITRMVVIRIWLLNMRLNENELVQSLPIEGPPMITEENFKVKSKPFLLRMND